MKLSVGYSLIAPERFSEAVIRFRDSISEIYFSWPGVASGRSIGAVDEKTSYEAQTNLIYDLEHFGSMGIPLVLLLNGNCYGAESISKTLSKKVTHILHNLIDGGLPITAVTTASPYIASIIKKNFPRIQVRASVNMRISHWEGIAYLAEYFDFFYAAKELNRNLDLLLGFKEKADELGKEIGILANSGCLNHCSNQIFHDNLVSHEQELEYIDSSFSPIQCRNYIGEPENWSSLLSRSNWIRPEDLDLYSSITSTVKLATRMHTNPYMVIASYAEKIHHGNLLDLTEPSFAPLVAPRILDSTQFPKGWSTYEHSEVESRELLSSVLKMIGE